MIELSHIVGRRRLYEFEVPTRILDATGVSALLLGAATIAYRYKKHQEALSQIQKLEASMKERVDVVSELKRYKSKLKGLPLTVVTKLSEYETVLKPKIMTLGLNPVETWQVLKVTQEVVREVMAGNNVYVWSVHGKKAAVFLITPPTIARIVFLHELGHLRSIKAGTNLARLDMGDIKRSFFLALNELSTLYSKHGKYGAYREEQRAWDIAGVPPGNPLRKAALASHEYAGKLSKLIIKMGIAVVAYPIVRDLLKPSRLAEVDVGILRSGVLKQMIPGQMVDLSY